MTMKKPGWPRGRLQNVSVCVIGGARDMSTITRETGSARPAIPLPNAGRGDAIFGLAAVAVSVLALIAKFAGTFT